MPGTKKPATDCREKNTAAKTATTLEEMGPWYLTEQAEVAYAGVAMVLQCVERAALKGSSLPTKCDQADRRHRRPM
jgi:hypothetical protein